VQSQVLPVTLAWWPARRQLPNQSTMTGDLSSISLLSAMFN